MTATPAPAPSPFAQIRHETDDGQEYWAARELVPLLGYTNWRNVARLVQCAVNLIAHGMYSGGITPLTVRVALGHGAMRGVDAYQLDRTACDLIVTLARSYKLTGAYVVRNETVLLRMLQKYSTCKGIPFQFQVAVGAFVYDACVADGLLIEIDEPHHRGSRPSRVDARKTAAVAVRGMDVLRVTLDEDMIDVILALEERLSLDAGCWRQVKRQAKGA